MKDGKGRRVLIAVAVLLTLAALWWGITGIARTPPRLNVILISIDTLRPDRMGVYGHRPMGMSTTPFLDDLAAEGAIFAAASSTSSWTLPGHYTMMSGLPDDLHGMVHDSVPPPGDDVPLMADIFRKAGYATAGFYSGPYLHECFGFDRGFETYEPCLGFTTIFDMAGATTKKMSRGKIGAETARTEKQAHEAVTSGRVTRRAVDFVSDHAGKGDGRPFFLFLHYFDVHNDYLPPPPLDTRFGPPYDGWVDGRGVMTDPRFHAGMERRDLEHLAALYDGEIASVDRSLDLFFRALEKLDPSLLDNSVVVITSDHGEEFFDHGRLGHRHSLYESAVRVPLIFRCPAHIPAGGEIPGPVSLCDILPTLLDLTGIETPPIVTGASLLPTLQKGIVPRRPVLLELTETPRGDKLDGVPDRGNLFRKHLALRLGDLKLITVQERFWSRDNPSDFTGNLLRESHELYDLKADPGERQNLYPAQADLFQEALRAREGLFDTLREKYETFRMGKGKNSPREMPEEIR